MAKIATLEAVEAAAKDAVAHGEAVEHPLSRMMLPYVERARQLTIPRQWKEWRTRPETVARLAIELFTEESHVIV